MNIVPNTIYNEDCLETMRRMPDGSVDLTVTSPPYDGLREYNGYSFDFEHVARSLYRVTKDGGVVVWIVGDGTNNGIESGTSFRQALFFKHIGFNLHDTMIYQKSTIFAYSPLNMRCKQAFEYMFVFSKGKPNTYNEIKDVPVKKAGTMTTGQRGRQANGALRQGSPFLLNELQARSNIWTYATGNNHASKDRVAFEHPAIFPEKLAADHIICWSLEGQLVYDPFMGSGTTAKACKKLRRDYIGSEISKEYCEIAKKRLQQGVLL